MRYSALKIWYYVSLILSFVSVISMMANYYPCRVEQTTHFSNSLPITCIEKVYISNNNIVVTHNVISGIIQFFDDSGKFLNGIHLATTRDIDSTQISFVGEKIYLWEERSQTIYLFDNYTYTNQIIDRNITTKDEFFRRIPSDDLEYECKINRKGQLSIISNSTNKAKHIILDAKFDHYSYIESVIFVFLFGFLSVFLKKIDATWGQHRKA